MSAYLRKGRPSSMYSSSTVYPKLHFSELWLFHCSLTPPVFDIYLVLKLSLLGPWSCLELFRQETRVSLTHLRDAFIGQSRSPNIVPFHMLHIVSYCAIVTLSLRHAICTIFDFKNAVTLKTGLGVRQDHWKCHHVIECI